MSNQALIDQNNQRWSKATFKDSSTAMAVAKRLCAKKPVYKEIENITKVPWYIIAVIHEREASQDFSRSIAQGDRWDRVSTHVPKGRGPFHSFKDAAIDALTDCAPHAANWTDWSHGGALTLLELYNGLGYAKKGRPSPYIWSGTNQYQSGKYGFDGVYDPDVVDRQLGCALILKNMSEIDYSVPFKMASGATEEPADASKSEEATTDAPDLGEKLKSKWEAWSWLKDFSWAAIGRQAGIIGAMFMSFWTEHQVLCLTVGGLVAAYAIWNAFGRPNPFKRAV